MTPSGRAPLASLRRITSTRPQPVAGERCDMCAEPIAEEHQHVVNLESRSLMCTCRGCYLLFTAEQAALRYRAVPDRYLSFPDFSFGAGEWDDLQIPVGLAFLFQQLRAGPRRRVLPGPRRGHGVGAAARRVGHGSSTPTRSWAMLRADVEALLVRGPDREHPGFSCFVVPIDACYELVGRLRSLWRGFDGGQEARAAIDEFFAMVAERSRPGAAPATPGRRHEHLRRSRWSTSSPSRTPPPRS